VIAELVPTRLLPSTNAWFWQRKRGMPQPWPESSDEGTQLRSGLWCGNGRLQSAAVPQAARSAEQLDLLCVNFKHFVQRDKHRFHTGTDAVS
jgi:hypothetical protein